MNVFISHSESGGRCAQLLAQALRDQGVTTWLDAENLAVGQGHSDAVEQALAEARGVVFLIDAAEGLERRQHYEWSMALESAWIDPQRKLIPVLIDNAEPPAFLRNRCALKVGLASADWSKVARQIVEILRRNAVVDENEEILSPEDRDSWIHRLDEIQEGTNTLRRRHT